MALVEGFCNRFFLYDGSLTLDFYFLRVKDIINEERALILYFKEEQEQSGRSF